MKYMPVTDSMFLIAETREQPMHVGGLQLFEPRAGQSATELAEEMFETFHDTAVTVDATFRRRPAPPAAILGNLAWTHDEEIDFDYHVRRAVLPPPGRVRELLRYVSLNHGALLDRNRPMWEMHIVEGLTDGQVALYSKIHHSLVDGVSALRLLQRTLTTDPYDRAGRTPWTLTTRARPANTHSSTPRGSARDSMSGLLRRAGGVVDAAGQLAGIGPAAARIAWTAATNDNFAAPFVPAPKTMLDVAIGSARRFAAQQWRIERLHAVAEAMDITLNDVVVAMCSGAMRSYLIDNDALPDESLIALMPVSMHSAEDTKSNAITAIMCKLATDQPDPKRRLDELVGSTREAKNVVRGLGSLQALALGAVSVAPLALATVPGFHRLTPPQFNLMISNVPGPSEELYWNGARLTGVYPVSIPMEGLALNITVTSTAGHINFGLTAARRELPSMQRLLTHLDTALEELEKVANVTPNTT